MPVIRLRNLYGATDIIESDIEQYVPSYKKYKEIGVSSDTVIDNLISENDILEYIRIENKTINTILFSMGTELGATNILNNKNLSAGNTTIDIINYACIEGPIDIYLHSSDWNQANIEITFYIKTI